MQRGKGRLRRASLESLPSPSHTASARDGEQGGLVLHLRSGWLQKKDDIAFAFRRRWVFIRHGCLLSARSPGDRMSVEEVRFRNVTAVTIEGLKFALKSPSSSVVFKAATVDEARVWADVIQQHVMFALT
mmetsp:Transcript_8399/g.22436  ORF Transcript_8399/g.22436 Transcript_8399/m.22436 type:complete len:130 (-) Transcript_8399:205-594(-)